MKGDRILITGLHGFCGRHLGAHLAQLGHEVFGIEKSPGVDVPGTIVYEGDVSDEAFVLRVVNAVRPDRIFHLAALIAPDADLDLLFEVNVIGTQHLLDSVRSSGTDPVVLITGSSAVYGPVHEGDLPIRESLTFRLLNNYAVSKIAQEMLAYTYYARYGLKVVRSRAFNITGPGEPSGLVCSAFARQIAAIEADQHEAVLRVGNLTTQRDFLDVRDVVRAYGLVAKMGRPGQVYNVCSGRATAIQACLDALLDLTDAEIRIEQDADRMRPSDIPISVGDNSLVSRHTGWRPTIDLERSLADLLDGWRRQVRGI